MKRFRKAEISVALGLITAIVFSVVGFGTDCEKIRNNVVRLHILAESDCEADQRVKLLVRDALLESGSELFSGIADVSSAKEILAKEKEMLIDVAENVLEENGFDYDAEMYLEREYFDTKEYESFTMPAGEYLALKVVLGKGEGHNWWCVMFPPLCLPAASAETDIDTVLGKDCAKLIQSNPEYEMRFKIVEIYERIKNAIRN